MARYAKFFSLGGGGGTNNLQLPVGTILDATLRQVQDGTGTGSPLYLSTGGLRVGTTAASAMYWDDTNNRLGIGTTTPLGVLHLKSTAATTRMVMDGDAGQSKIITYRTAGLQRFGLYCNNTAESGANAGSDFAIRAYNDAGTLLTTPVFIKRSTGNVGINTTTPTQKLDVNGVSRFRDTLNIDNNKGLVFSYSGGTTGFSILNSSSNQFQINNANYGYNLITIPDSASSTAAVGIGTTSPTAKLQVKGNGSTSATTSLLVQNSSSVAALTVKDDLTSTFGGAVTAGVNNGTFADIILDYGGGTRRIRPGGNSLDLTDTLGNRAFQINAGGGNPRIALEHDGVNFVRGLVNLGYTSSGSTQQMVLSATNYVGHLTPFFDIKATGYANSKNTDLRLYTDNTTSGTYGNIIIGHNGTNATGNVGVGETSPIARLQVKGSGSTSATTALLVQNSSGTTALQVTDDRQVVIPANRIVQSSTQTIFYGTGSALWLGLMTTNTNEVPSPYDQNSKKIIIGNTSWATNVNSGIICIGMNQTGDTNVYGGIVIGNDSALHGPSGYRHDNNIIIGSNSGIGFDGNHNTGKNIVIGNSCQTTSQPNANKLTIIGNDINSNLSNAVILGETTQSVIIGSYSGLSASAQLQVDSTTKGFLPPRMTTAQKNAISSPANGLIVYDTDLVRPCFFNGATWITL
jgi:hypothetical protein